MKNKEIVKFLHPFLIKEKRGIIITLFLDLISALIGMTYGYFSGLAMSKVTENAMYVAILILIFNLFLCFAYILSVKKFPPSLNNF